MPVGPFICFQYLGDCMDAFPLVRAYKQADIKIDSNLSINIQLIHIYSIEFAPGTHKLTHRSVALVCTPNVRFINSYAQNANATPGTTL